MNTPDLVGESGYINEDHPDLFIPDRLWQVVFNEYSPINIKWFSYLLAGAEYKKKIQDTATGTSGSMKNISKNALLSISVPIPTLKEQEAIAQTLGDADGLIEQLEQLIAKKRAIKQGAMQELLTGKKRLYILIAPAFLEQCFDNRLFLLGQRACCFTNDHFNPRQNVLNLMS